MFYQKQLNISKHNEKDNHKVGSQGDSITKNYFMINTNSVTVCLNPQVFRNKVIMTRTMYLVFYPKMTIFGQEEM